MSETETAPVDPISNHFNGLVECFLDRIKNDSDGADMVKVVPYLQKVKELRAAWEAGGPANGKPGGARRGRPPKSASVEPVAGAEAPLTETQVEMDAAPTGRSRSRTNA